MISAGDLRPGATVERGGQLLQVLDFAHIKLGRGTAVVRTKLKNLTTGAVTEETFRPEEKFGRARIERSEAQYLYRDGDAFVVMDTRTYDQTPLSPEQVGEGARWLKENDTLTLLTHDDRVPGSVAAKLVELPVAHQKVFPRFFEQCRARKPAQRVGIGVVVDVFPCSRAVVQGLV